jgi:hypothetical protein
MQNVTFKWLIFLLPVRKVPGSNMSPAVLMEFHGCLQYKKENATITS